MTETKGELQARKNTIKVEEEVCLEILAEK